MHSMMKFEDIRIVRDMRNSVNRMVNCENANLNKVIDAANKQVAAIRYLDAVTGLDNLPLRLREVAQLRLTYPEMSLIELGELVPSGAISKSAVNHRLRKLVTLAETMQAKEGGAE